MKIIKNLKKWYENMTKEKCPNCNEIGFKDNEIEKRFIKKTTTFISDNSFDKYGSNNPMRNKQREIEVTTNIYNVKYLCQNCHYILEQEINDERDYGNIKILTTLEEYKKETKSNSDDQNNKFIRK